MKTDEDGCPNMMKIESKRMCQSGKSSNAPERSTVFFSDAGPAARDERRGGRAALRQHRGRTEQRRPLAVDLGPANCTLRPIHSGMRILTKLDRARSRLYRSQILQVNMRLKALAEIYTMHSFAQLCNLIFLSKFCQNFAKFLQKFTKFLLMKMC